MPAPCLPPCLPLLALCHVAYACYVHSQIDLLTKQKQEAHPARQKREAKKKYEKCQSKATANPFSTYAALPLSPLSLSLPLCLLLLLSVMSLASAFCIYIALWQAEQASSREQSEESLTNIYGLPLGATDWIRFQFRRVLRLLSIAEATLCLSLCLPLFLSLCASLIHISSHSLHFCYHLRAISSKRNHHNVRTTINKTNTLRIRRVQPKTRHTHTLETLFPSLPLSRRFKKSFSYE